MASRQMLASLWATATTVTVGLGRLEPKEEIGIGSLPTALFDEEVETPQSSSGYSSDSGDSVSLPSSSTSSGGPEEPWEEVEVCNGKWESRGILPGVSAWTPTNLDDVLLDTLTVSHARAYPERVREEEEDDDDYEAIRKAILAATGRLEDVVAEQVDDVLDWGVFIGWAPVPTLEEAEVLAAAAAAEEQQRRAAAALKKAARLAKYHHNNCSFKRKYHYYQ